MEMTSSEQAIGVLETCERALRKLMADASGEGDYLGVERITEMAKAIAGIAAEGRSSWSYAAAQPAADSQRAEPNGKSVPAGERRAKAGTDEYPRFFRRGDELVKVGWSKSEKKEYHHRAPRPVVDVVAAKVRQVGAKERLFNGDALLPLKDPTSGDAIPDYQGYVALAWLKHLRIVEQRGRRAGYTLATSKQIESVVAAAWPELPEWRG
jgi:hypothetical protein